MTTRTTRRSALPTPTRALTRVLAPLLGLALVAAGCSGEDTGTDGQSGSPSAGGSTDVSAAPSSASATPEVDPAALNYLKVPQGVILTPQGADLKIPGTATVAWELDKERIAALGIRVTKVERVTLKTLKDWILDKRSKESTPYFVHLRVANVGKTDLGGLALPVYAALVDDTLVSASSFESAFKPCPSTPLPAKFKPGEKLTNCLVYLAPDQGKMTNVAFYPGPGFQPVTWTGTIVQPGGEKKGDQKKNKKDQ